MSPKALPVIAAGIGFLSVAAMLHFTTIEVGDPIRPKSVVRHDFALIVLFEQVVGDDGDGKVTPFDSSRTPVQWGTYMKGCDLDPNARYIIPSKYDRLSVYAWMKKPDAIVAFGPLVQDGYNTARISWGVGVLPPNPVRRRVRHC